MTMRIGLFGGCFNPVHQGHFAAARGACAALQLDRVIFVPAGHPPLKGNAGLVDGKHRLAMLELAIAGDPQLAASAVEIDRPGPSFTVDTVRLLQGAMPKGTQTFFLLGNDCVARLPHWKGIDELHAMLRFAILPRGLEEGRDDDPRLIRLALPRMAVSSTHIRAIFADGGAPPVDLLHPQVACYVARFALYRTVEGRIHA